MLLRSFALWLLLTGSAIAQLNVVAVDAARLEGATGLLQLGEAVFVDLDSELQITPVAIVRIDSEAKNISVEVTDENRAPVQYDEITPTVIVLSDPGKYWVEVLAVDFAKEIFEKKRIVVEVGVGPDPPIPPPPPIPPDGPFDGLAARVRAVAQRMTAEQRNQIAGICVAVADKMRSFEYRQIAQSKKFIETNWPTPCEGACRQLRVLLGDDAKDRLLGWSESQSWYREVAKGVR